MACDATHAAVVHDSLAFCWLSLVKVFAQVARWVRVLWVPTRYKFWRFKVWRYKIWLQYTHVTSIMVRTPLAFLPGWHRPFPSEEQIVNSAGARL